MKSMRRVLRYDGLLPNKLKEGGGVAEITPDDIQQMKAFIEQHRSEETPFDIVMEGKTPGKSPRKAASVVRSWAEAGATWWLEAMWDKVDAMRGSGHEPVLRPSARARLGNPQ
jgi:hypothetical protein